MATLGYDPEWTAATKEQNIHTTTMEPDAWTNKHLKMPNSRGLDPRVKTQTAVKTICLLQKPATLLK